MDKTAEERLVAALSHCIVLVSLLIFVVKVLGVPAFPRTALWFLTPYLVLLPLYWKRSPFVRTHLLQAVCAHVFGFTMALVPWVLSQLVRLGVLGETWRYTGFQGNGITATWALMALIIAMWSLVIFTAAVDGISHGFAGEAHRYPMIGGLVRYTED